MNNKNNNKFNTIFKVMTYITFVIVFGLTVLYLFESEKGQLSFFTSHFAIPIVLFLVGIIAILMPLISNKSYRGENKGDNFMFVIGLILFASSIITLILSFK